MERFVYNGRKSDGSYGLTDDLTMLYSGNRLVRVVDAADPVVTNGSMDFKDGTDTGVEYTYNASGALTSDLNKGISGIDYDINGNMSKVTFSNGNTTEYVYSQSGAKQRVIHGTVTALPFAEPGISTAEAASVSRDTTEYIGDFVFRNGVLDRLLFRGGYMDIAGGVPRYHYFATDHLGSVRTVYGEDGVAEQLLTYDLFGGIIPELSTSMGMQPYGYNGKELDHTHGLDWYDYGARHYDSPIGRWTTMDPLCEKYYNVSPYVYCLNNPVRLIDIYGLYPDFLLSFHKSPFYRADYYTLNLPAVRLMSLVSGISEEYIRKVQIMQRGFGHYYPLYSPDNGGGAITLGNTPDNVSISFTPNFFEDNKAKYSGHGYGQDFYRWMYLLSHEVTHIKHIKKCRNEILYIGSFLKDYIEYGHDNTPREKEADEGMKEFNDFNTFINNNIGNNALEKLFKSVKSDSQKINTINLWWKIYDGKKKEHNLFE